MTVKFAKELDVVVTASGYGYVRHDNKEHRDLWISITSGTEQVTVEAKDIPALIKALEAAVVDVNKQADKTMEISRRALERKAAAK
jgi:hypothetical protein